MKILIYLLLTISFSCKQKQTSTVEVNSQNLKDTFDIGTLYIDQDIIAPLNVLGGFSLRHSKSKNEVKLVSSKNINGNDIEFVILYKDSLNIYDKANFYPGDIDFPIKQVYFNVNGIKTLIDNSTKINVANIWYSEKEDKSIKFYKIGKTSYILLHGINLFCNGRQCNDDTIYIIIITDNGSAKVKGLKYNRIYPYFFNNIELVDSKTPFIFLPKSEIKKLKNKADFEKYHFD